MASDTDRSEPVRSFSRWFAPMAAPSPTPLVAWRKTIDPTRRRFTWAGPSDAPPIPDTLPRCPRRRAAPRRARRWQGCLARELPSRRRTSESGSGPSTRRGSCAASSATCERDEELGHLAGPAHGDVAGLLGEGLAGEHVGPLDGQALGLVDRQGVGVAQMTGLEVGLGQQALAFGRLDRQTLADGALDRAGRPVHDADAPVVAQAHHLVAHGEAPPVELQHVDAEAARTPQRGAGGLVEARHLGTPDGQHHGVVARVVATRPSARPARDAPRPHLARAVHPPGPLVGGERNVGPPEAQGVESQALPGFALAPVLGELDGTDSLDEAGQGTAGLDLGQLAGIANEDELRPGVVGGGQESGQCPRPHHARLVDDDHVGGPEAERSGADAGEHAGQGVRRDARPLRQRPGGAGRERRAEDARAGTFPGQPGRGEGEGLAGPGLAHHDIDAGARGGEALDHGHLLAREQREVAERAAEGPGVGHGAPGVAKPSGCIEE